jgi:hypothetical protein
MQVRLAACETRSFVLRRRIGGEEGLPANHATGSMALPTAPLVFMTVLWDISNMSTFVCTFES